VGSKGEGSLRLAEGGEIGLAKRTKSTGPARAFLRFIVG